MGLGQGFGTDMFRVGGVKIFVDGALRAYYHVPHLLTLEDFLGMGPGQGFGTDMFRVGGVKIFVDGAGGDGLDRRFADFKWRRKSSTRSSCGPTATASS